MLRHCGRVRLCNLCTVALRPHCPWDSPGKNNAVGCVPHPRGSSQPRNRTHVSRLSCTAGTEPPHLKQHEISREYFQSLDFIEYTPLVGLKCSLLWISYKSIIEAQDLTRFRSDLGVGGSTTSEETECSSISRHFECSFSLDLFPYPLLLYQKRSLSIRVFIVLLYAQVGLPSGASAKEPTCQSRRRKRHVGSILGPGRPPGGRHGDPLPYSCLESLGDRGAWWAEVHRVTQSQTWPKQLSTHTHTHDQVSTSSSLYANIKHTYVIKNFIFSIWY